MSGYIDLYCLNSVTDMNPWTNSFEISIVCSTKQASLRGWLFLFSCTLVLKNAKI